MGRGEGGMKGGVGKREGGEGSVPPRFLSRVAVPDL